MPVSLDNKLILRFRTAGLVIVLSIVLAVVAWHSPAAASAIAPYVMGLGIAVCGKSAMEHLGNGGGIRGAVAALMTDAKPGEKAGQP